MPNFDRALLEAAESEFLKRERQLQRRRESNEKNAPHRAEYRRAYVDATKPERNRRAADKRQAQTGFRTPPSSRRRTPEQQARHSEYMKTWNDENRERIRAQNAERQRRYRRASGVKPLEKAPPCACGNLHEAKDMCKSCYMRDYRQRKKEANVPETIAGESPPLQRS